MTNTSCARCGVAASGNYCASCGAVLDARHCTECGAALQRGARFCNQCGAGVHGGAAASATAGAGAGGGAAVGGGASPAGGASGARNGGSAGASGEAHVAWWFAGGLLVLLIMVVAWPIVRPEQVGPTPPPAPQPTGAAAVDLSSMTPRQAADRLHRRVTEAAEAGDSAQVAQFAPMAVMAYDQARPLDLHGLYDMASMQQLAGDFAGAQATAEEGLAEASGHLLLLYAAGQAAEAMNDPSGAREYYQRLLDAFDAERFSGREEYEAHVRMLPLIQTEATAFLAANAGGDDE